MGPGLCVCSCLLRRPAGLGAGPEGGRRRQRARASTWSTWSAVEVCGATTERANGGGSAWGSRLLADLQPVLHEMRSNVKSLVLINTISREQTLRGEIISVFSVDPNAAQSFGVIRWPECDCVCAGVGLSGGRGRLLTHVHRASACTLNAVGLLPVSGRGDARVAPPCPTTLCVWRNLPYLT